MQIDHPATCEVRVSPDDFPELVRRCLAGDQAAIAQLVDRFERPVLGLCLRMLGNRQDAEDAAQESFVRVIRSLHRWDAAREFGPWLFTIVGNRCRSMLASRARRQPAVTLIEESLPDHRPPADDHGHLSEEVQQALAALRDEYRQAFVLFHEQELSYSEIAEVLECPVGTVKTWIYRARAELARRLRERFPEDLPNVVRRV